MNVHIQMPLIAIEPLFTALSTISPLKVNRLEMKAVSLLKSHLVFELEKLMETPEEMTERSIDFNKLFEEERKKRFEATNLEPKGIY